MKKYCLYIFVVVIALLSCNDDEQKTSTYLHEGQAFLVVDRNGNDLLDPSHPDAITSSQLKVYFLVNGEKMLARDYLRLTNPDAALENYDGFLIVEPEAWLETYSLGVFLDSSVRENGGIATTYIEWNGTDTDTIKSIITNKNNGNYYTSIMISYNDSVWSPTEDNYFFTIVK